MFPPEDPERQATLAQLRQAPEPQAASPPRSRWTLELIRRLCPAVAGLQSCSGLWRRLRRWKIVSKRGRRRRHSPDPQYPQKLQRLEQARNLAQSAPQRFALLYADEKTFYRQPPAGQAWEGAGRGGQQQPPANLSHGANTKSRLGGALDAFSGRVLWVGGSRVGVRELQRLLGQIRQAYPRHERIFLAWDNGPVHAHPQVLATAAQEGIELLFLPTYAPWTNPIEKLWGWLQQEVLLMHRLCDDWEQLKRRAGQFLDRFATPSPELLRYVGLLPD